MYVLVGAILTLLGVVGVRYAPRIVAVQRERGMAPLEGEEIGDDERIQVTRGIAVLLTIVGFVLIVYGVAIV